MPDTTPPRPSAGLDTYPPPWAYDDNREPLTGAANVYDSLGNVVANFGDMEDNTWQDIATGQLCAAAPDLYDALAELVFLKDHQPADYAARKPLAWEAARQALQKARGK
jgi:hypothetical protein